jgi:hypothetical protein
MFLLTLIVGLSIMPLYCSGCGGYFTDSQVFGDHGNYRNAKTACKVECGRKRDIMLNVQHLLADANDDSDDNHASHGSQGHSDESPNDGNSNSEVESVSSRSNRLNRRNNRPSQSPTCQAGEGGDLDRDEEEQEADEDHGDVRLEEGHKYDDMDGDDGVHHDDDHEISPNREGRIHCDDYGSPASGHSGDYLMSSPDGSFIYNHARPPPPHCLPS